MKRIFISIYRRFTHAPVYYIGPHWFNLLGLNILRIFYHRFIDSMRGLLISVERCSIYKVLQKDGIVVINDFLATEDFQYIEKEILKIARDRSNYIPNFQNTGLTVCNRNLNDIPHIVEILSRNLETSNVANVIRKTMGIRRLSQPEGYLQILECNELEDIGDHNCDLHPDRFFDTVKLFLSIKQVQPVDGPYGYCYKSHKYNFQRYAYDYRMGLKWVAIKKSSGINFINEMLNSEALTSEKPILTKSDYDKLKLDVSHLNVEKNALIISNQSGFHLRSKMGKGGNRITLRIIYHNCRPSILRSVILFIRRLIK